MFITFAGTYCESTSGHLLLTDHRHEGNACELGIANLLRQAFVSFVNFDAKA